MQTKKVFWVFGTLLIILGLLVAPTNTGLSSAQAGQQTLVINDVGPAITDGAASPIASHRLIVQLASPPLSEYAASGGISLLTNGKRDFQSPDAQIYINQLKVEQTAFISQMSSALPTATVSQYIDEQGSRVNLTYQVSFNGMTIDPGTTPKEVAARMLMKLPGVIGVYNDYAHQPDLYASVPLINASAAWTNSAIGGKGNAGAGIKFASMDGGAHHAAPMFDGTGYSYPPGYPVGGLGLTANNNGKIIVSRAYFRTWDPPSVGDENPWPGTQGTSHGTHTASTAAGNEVQADYLGLTETISGVAPRAWVMSYRVFYNSITNDGSFYNAEGIAALEDILLDGADVLNNSWGGGPGSVGGEFDPLDTALINVANSGTFVSMSAGNAGPNNGTTDHPSDEYISVAASQSGGTLASGRLGVTAPTPVNPPSLEDIAYSSATFGGILAPGAVYPYNFISANSVDPANVEGCSAWPADTFAGKAALIMRGTCEFGVKVLNAEEAGAEFVIVYNHAAGGDGLINMGPGVVGGAVTIPSVFIGNTPGTLMDAWYVTNGAASEVTVDTFAFHTTNTPDVIASFSSRGPGVGNVQKPDITAPGVNILAQGYTPGATGEARHLGWGQVSGTSMASPHVAGAAVLIRQIHPDWSNAYIKSALMSTSKYVGIWNADATHAQPLDMGAGRLDLTNAANPGVILDPPSVSGGLIVTGATETIQVNVTNVAAAAETYDLSVASVTGTYPTPTIGALPGFSVSPAQITLAPGETKLITVTFDSSLGAIGDNQGFIVLDGSIHDAHMPAWIRVSPLSTADVLVIDNDGSSSLLLPDYASYYTTALDTLGMTYDVLDTDASAGSEVNFLPEAAILASYEAVIYFTGDNYFPNGSFTVPTPLTAQDMERLTEYANSGGIVIAMGQDLASVLNSTSSSTASFFYSSVLGGSYLQDSVTGFDLPVLPVIADVNGPAALQGILVDLNGVTGDGAHNQAYIDELSHAPNLDPNPIGDHYNYTPLLRYPGPNNLDQGTVAIAHRDQPNLEVPGTDYLGRSIYTSFGLEGVNNGLDGISRSDLLESFFDWATDMPAASILDTTYANASNLTMFQATLTSNLAGVVGETYRWDFGDGSAFTPAFKSADVSHVYATCGIYTVRVEVTDSWGNKAIGTYQAAVNQCTTHEIYLPVILIDATP